MRHALLSLLLLLAASGLAPAAIAGDEDPLGFDVSENDGPTCTAVMTGSSTIPGPQIYYNVDLSVIAAAAFVGYEFALVAIFPYNCIQGLLAGPEDEEGKEGEGGETGSGEAEPASGSTASRGMSALLP